jgi:hypothetical protein
VYGYDDRPTVAGLLIPGGIAANDSMWNDLRNSLRRRRILLG